MHRKNFKFKDLQSLLGHLHFACKVIIPGRCFHDHTRDNHEPNHFIKRHKAERADLM